MILILSEKGDITTNIVIDWLDYYNVDFYRLNWEEFCQDISVKITQDHNILNLKMGGFKLCDFKVVWYRKWDLDYYIENNGNLNSNNWISISNNLSNEIKKLSDFLIYNIECKSKIIGKPSKLSQNKLIQLSIAKECGFLIPATFILTKDNHKLLNNDLPLITKAISDNILIHNEGHLHMTYTNKIEENIIDQSFSFPSLFQEEIKKEYELRVFFFKKRIFTMCILSQENKNTEVDFRRYDTRQPNRNEPYQLPKEIELCVLKFADKIDLETGSIDLIKSNNNYYFLEVNPIGQFGMVSKPCNYHIEKYIAEELIKELNS